MGRRSEKGRDTDARAQQRGARSDARDDAARTDVREPPADEVQLIEVPEDDRATTSGAARDAAAHHGADADSRVQGPTDIPTTGWKQVGRRVIDNLKRDHVSLLAAGVAFKGLLALFPAMVAAISIWGLATSPEQAAQQLEDLTAALPDEAAQLISTQLEAIATSEPGTLSIAVAVSILVALWAASSGVAGLIEGCNAAYSEVDDRGFVKKRGLALLFMLGAIVFVAVTFTIIAVVPVVLGAVGLGGPAEVAIRILQWPLLAVLMLGALAVVYKYAPDRADPQLRWTSGGAAIATVLWLFASAGFAVYVRFFGDFDETYGTFAGIVILMLWLYLTSFVVLLGAEINAESERQTLHDTTTGPPRPRGQRGADVADVTPGEDSARRR